VLVLHIGTHKTGTSALQTYLSRRPEVLEQAGARYVQSARSAGKAHHELPWAIRGKRGAEMSAWRDLRAELDAYSSVENIVSSEGFWFSDPAAVKAELQGVRDIRIVMYLRRQDKYLQSLYKQSVTGGRKTAFSDWLERSRERGDYLAVVEQWAAQFGADALVVRPYERDGHTIDVVKDFGEFLGIDVGERKRGKTHNPSPRLELLQFIRAFNQLDLNVDRDKFFYSFIHRNPDYIRSADLLSYEQSTSLLSEYADGNRVLAERYHGGVALFPDLTREAAADIWPPDGEAYFSMIVHVLDAVVALASSGEIKPKAVAPAKRRRRHD
jgi:hypothetical protein